MAMEPETFLRLSGLKWSAIGSISTAAAVIVALFLPFYLECKKVRNINRLIVSEIESNYGLLKYADQIPDSKNSPVPRYQLICAVVVHIDYDVWNKNKQTIAETSADKHLRYSTIESKLENIKMQAGEIRDEIKSAMRGDVKKYSINPYALLIDGEVKETIKLIEEKLPGLKVGKR